MTDRDDDGPRPHQRRPWSLRRLRRAMGLDRHPVAVVVIGGALMVAVLAVAVAARGAPGTAAIPARQAAATAPSTSLPAIIPVSPTESGVAGATAAPAVTDGPGERPDAASQGVVATRIRVPRLGIDLRIVEGDGVTAPMNKAAHYPGTGWPHGGTNIYIYGHAQPGMFLPLWDTLAGDEVDLILVDGSTARYEVAEVRRNVAWNAVQYLDPTSSEQLTLQTSTSYQPTSPRFIVIAVPRT